MGEGHAARRSTVRNSANYDVASSNWARRARRRPDWATSSPARAQIAGRPGYVVSSLVSRQAPDRGRAGGTPRRTRGAVERAVPPGLAKPWWGSGVSAPRGAHTCTVPECSSSLSTFRVHGLTDEGLESFGRVAASRRDSLDICRIGRARGPGLLLETSAGNRGVSSTQPVIRRRHHSRCSSRRRRR